jgi:hypothetical protein
VPVLLADDEAARLDRREPVLRADALDQVEAVARRVRIRLGEDAVVGEQRAEQREVAERLGPCLRLRQHLLEQSLVLGAPKAGRLLGQIGGDARLRHELEHPRPADRIARTAVPGEAERDELTEQEPVVRAVQRREPVDALPGQGEGHVHDLVTRRRRDGALRGLAVGVQADDVLALGQRDHAVGAAGRGAVDYDRRVVRELHDQPCHGCAAMFPGGSGRRQAGKLRS